MLKRLLLLFSLLLLLSCSVFATDITISSFQLQNFHLPGTTATIRVYYSRTFFDSNGQQVIGGAVGSANFYKLVSCTVASNTISCPSFTLVSTLDSSDPEVTVSAWLYDAQGTRRNNIFTNQASDAWSVPVTLGTSITLAQLNTSNASAPIYPPPTYPNDSQVDAKINIAVGTLNDASTTIKGRTKLSAAPISSTNPIAVGDNDSRMTDARTPTGTAGGDLQGTYPNPTLNLANKTLNTPKISNGTRVRYFGDSNTSAFGASDPAHGYAAMVAAAMGWTNFTNSAVSGAQCGDQQDTIYGTTVGMANENYVLAVGIGDEANYTTGVSATDANLRLAFQRCYFAELLYLSLPDTAKVKANAMTSTGSWTATPTVYGFGMQSTVNGSTLSFTSGGDVAFIGYLLQASSTATGSVTIDGINYGTISSGAPGGVNITTSGFGRVAIPNAISIPLSTSGPHQVTITVTSAAPGNALYIDFGAGNAGLLGAESVSLSSPHVYALELTGLTAQGYIDHGGSDANNGLFNAAIKQDVDILKDAGLNLALVPIASAVNPTTDYFDFIHWANAAHSKIKDLMLAITNQTPTARNKEGLGHSTVPKIRGSVILDFTSKTAGQTETLTITGAFGAMDGDKVSLGIPAALLTDNKYEWWVSAPSTISVRRTCINDSNPAPATIKYEVGKF